MIDFEWVFRGYLKQKGLKCTPQRMLVLRYAFELHDHFEAEDLFFRAKKDGRRLSRGTIYRTLPLLLECRLIRQVEFVGGHLHYEHTFGHAHHEHLICVRCGKIIEFSSNVIEHELRQICKDRGFVLKGHKIEATGYCNECRGRLREGIG